ncbi:restriction endonuclease subunit S [Helicobacter pylori]|uniref:restriction endonuclease subunit S n=1 Tax=Helicobacter pylori TaxID=210 RepID=UPI0013CE1584|nr:restriction endonuclease subunit S [Helicobacter pylori]
MDALMLPSNWQRVRLGDIFFITAGGDLSKPHYSNTKQSDFNYPIYSNAIEKKGLCGYSSFFIIKNKSITITARGTIGFAFFRDYPYVPIGRLLVLQPKISNIDCRFYAEYINSKVKFNTEQTTIPQLTIPKVALCEIPLPPPNEQIAIANILSALDNYLHALRALILKKESVKKALSFELLSQRKRLKGFNQNWQRVRLGDMTTSFTKQTGFDYSASIKPTLIKEQLPNYIPFIQNKDFSGHYINYKTDYFIPNEIAIRFPQILLNEKCLLISIVGSIGNVAVFNHSQDAFTGCAIAVLKFKEKKSLDFVMHFLMSASGQKSLLNIVKASSHKSIILADLRDLLILLPPLNEQIAIANILSALDSEIISLKNKKRQFENIKKALNHDLMSAKIRVLKK